MNDYSCFSSEKPSWADLVEEGEAGKTLLKCDLLVQCSQFYAFFLTRLALFLKVLRF